MIRRTLWAALPACLLLLSLTGTAAGHASLVESDPPDGGTIEQTPYVLTAQFDEELDPDRSSIVVENSDGDEVARGGVTPDDDTVMTVDLPPLPPGDYQAFWTARTPDDDGVTRDTISFTIEQAPATPTPPITPGATAAASTPGRSPTATASPTSGPTSSPRPSPSPSPSPTPAEPGTTDLLIALLVAGGVVGLIAVYLLRRGRS